MKNQNMTDVAKSGMSLESLDIPRIKSIILAQASAKGKGLTFRPGVLFGKVAKEVKSLAGLSESQRLPDNVANEIKSLIASLPLETLENLTKVEGYQYESLSGFKVKANYRTGEVTRVRIATFRKEQTIEMQLKDIIWTISQQREQIKKLQNEPGDTRDKQEETEGKIAKIEERIKANDQLRRVLKVREAEAKGVPVEVNEEQAKVKGVTPLQSFNGPRVSNF